MSECCDRHVKLGLNKTTWLVYTVVNIFDIKRALLFVEKFMSAQL